MDTNRPGSQLYIVGTFIIKQMRRDPSENVCRGAGGQDRS